MTAPGHGLAAALAGVVLLAWLAMMGLALRDAALPPEGRGTVLAVFTPGEGRGERLAAVIGAGGAPLQPAWFGMAWIAHSDEPGFAGRLREAGAVAVLRGLPLELALYGCVGVFR